MTAPTCAESGEQIRACAICGAEQSQELAATGHIWNGGVVTKEPTESAEGVRTYTCAACGQTKTEPIAKLPQTGGDKPQGGDRPDGSADANEGSAQEGAQDELPQTGDGTFALIGLPALALLLVSAGLILAARNRAEHL